MPDYDRLPNELDVEVLLKSAAFWPVGTPDSAKVLHAVEQATTGVRAAATEFGDLAGYKPFLSTAEEGVPVPFDVPGKRFAGTGVLKLNNGLLRLDGVTINGVAVDASLVRPQPADALAKGEPYTWLRFPGVKRLLKYYATELLQVEVTGRWGYGTVMPEDAWAEILQYGAVKALSQIENTQSVASLVQDGLSKSWDIVGIITQKDLLNEWGRRFRATAERYRRKV